jgi:penicillin-binding protein 1A
MKARPPVSLIAIARGLILVVLLLGVATGAGIGMIVYRQINAELPSIERVIDYSPPVTTQVFAANGTLVAEFFSEKRYLVPIDRIPRLVRDAFIAAEDDGFYQHRGIEPVSITRALINNLVAGGRIQGGSTITQQVIKQLALTPEKSYERKLKEMILALRLEEHLPKDEILELYLNHIYLGSGAYGVSAAAHEYFGKEIEDLNLAEAALLAGLPQAPTRYSPFRNWPEAKARQRYVLTRMADAGFITEDQRDEALNQPLALATRKGNFLAAPYFVEHIRRILEERFGQKALYEMGLRIHTTLDLDLQHAADAAVRAGVEALSARHGGYRGIFREMDPADRQAYLAEREEFVKANPLEMSKTYDGLVTSLRQGIAHVQVGPVAGEVPLDGSDGKGQPALQINDMIRVKVVDIAEDGYRFELDPTTSLEGALVAMDPATGEVKALVGGYDFDRSQFNRATQARRQPGSAFKPLVYAAALDRNFTPASVIVDEPVCYSDNGKHWCPQNYSADFKGPTTLRTALMLSRNVVTVKLVNSIGARYLVGYLRRFGLKGPLPANLSLALGTAELTPLELARAYCALASQGMLPKPTFVTGITDARGNVLERTEPELEQAIPAETAYQITSMLQDVVRRGTGRQADGLGRPTAGKTGTTNHFHDNWFIGYTPGLLTAVWLGFDDKRSLGSKETGGRNAAPIWKAFMDVAVQGLPTDDFPIPAGLKCVNVDPETGLRAVPGGAARLECFRQGAEPSVPVAPMLPVAQHAVEEQPLVRPLVAAPSAPPSVNEFLHNDY